MEILQLRGTPDGITGSKLVRKISAHRPRRNLRREASFSGYAHAIGQFDAFELLAVDLAGAWPPVTIRSPSKNHPVQPDINGLSEGGRPRPSVETIFPTSGGRSCNPDRARELSGVCPQIRPARMSATPVPARQRLKPRRPANHRGPNSVSPRGGRV